MRDGKGRLGGPLTMAEVPNEDAGGVGAAHAVEHRGLALRHPVLPLQRLPQRRVVEGAPRPAPRGQASAPAQRRARRGARAAGRGRVRAGGPAAGLERGEEHPAHPGRLPQQPQPARIQGRHSAPQRSQPPPP